MGTTGSWAPQVQGKGNTDDLCVEAAGCFLLCALEQVVSSLSLRFLLCITKVANSWSYYEDDML